MQTISNQFLNALTSGHDVLTTLVHKNLITGVQTTIQDIDGQVGLDVTSFCRRTLTFTAPNLESLFQTLLVPGSEITVQSGVRYGSTPELVPAGVYRIEDQSLGFAPDGTQQVTCYDRCLPVQMSRMGANRASVPSNTVPQEIDRLVRGAFTSTYAPFPGWSFFDTSVTAKVGALIYDDGQRDNAITKYCTDNSLEFFTDASGGFVLRKIPTVAGMYGTWSTVMGVNGIMIDGNRARSLKDTRNAIVLTTTASDIQMTAVEVANTNNPLTDPLSTLGPLGYQRLDYAGNFRTTAQATAAGNTMLAQYSAAQQQVSITAVVNAALDGWDQLLVVPLVSDLGTHPAESHIVQSYSLPLTYKSPMTITGRAVIPT